jgi:hypothetical protein
MSAGSAAVSRTALHLFDQQAFLDGLIIAFLLLSED